MQIVTDLIYNRNKSLQRVSERDGASESVRRPILFIESWSSTILLNRRHGRASWLSVNLALLGYIPGFATRLTMKRMWITWLSIVLLAIYNTKETVAEPSYVVTIPPVVRPGENLVVHVDLFNTNSPVNVMVELRKGRPAILVERATIPAGKQNSKDISLKLPYKHYGGSYTVFVKGSGGLDFRVFRPVKYSASTMIFIQIDRGMYAENENVKSRVLVFRPDMRPYLGSLTIEAYNGENKLVRQWKDVSPAQGVYANEFNIGVAPSTGTWKLRAIVKGLSVEKTFIVRRYVVPDYTVQIDCNPKEFTSTTRSISCTVISRYTFDKDVNGTLRFQAVTQNNVFLENQFSNIVGRKTINIQLAGRNVDTDLDIIAQVGNPSTATTVTNEVTVTLKDSGALSWTLQPRRATFVRGQPLLTFLKFETRRSMTVRLTVTTTSNEIRTCRLARRPYKYVIGSNTTRNYDINVDANGYGKMTIEPRSDASELTFTVYDGALRKSESLTAVPHQNQYILIEPIGSFFNTGSSISFHVVSPNALQGDLIFEVYSRGRRVSRGKLEGNGGSKQTITIPSTPDFYPSAVVLVYLTKPNGDVSMDRAEFEMRGNCLNNNVSVAVDRSEYQPGNIVNFDIGAKANSTVFLMSVDKSVQALQTGYDVVMSDVYDSLNGDYGIEITDLAFNSNKYNGERPDQGLPGVCDANYNPNMAGGRSDNKEPSLKPEPPLQEGEIRAETIVGCRPNRIQPKQVRNWFPKTWLWESVFVRDNQPTKIQRKVPDSITTWVTSAFSVHNKFGFGLLTPPATPPGIIEGYNLPSLILLNEHNLTTKKFTLTIPPDAVPGTKKVYATVTGDIIAPTIHGIENLIRLPWGCGEQNMINFAPSVYVLIYLHETSQLKNDIREKGIEAITRGKDHECNYRRPSEGSFAVWGTRSPRGSKWLTAYVLRVFHKALQFIAIDMDIFVEGIQWLATKQESDGSFGLEDLLYHRNMMGGVNTKIELTSYIILSMLENNDIVGCEEIVKEAVRKAVNYILSNKESLSNNQFGLAITAYALVKAGRRSEARELYQLLVNKGVNQGETIFWKQGCESICDSIESKWQSPNPRARPIEIETASYALLYLSETEYIQEGMKITKWLTSQRNPDGGWATTQDTVVSIEALTRFSTLLRDGGVFNTNLTISMPLGTPNLVKLDTSNRALLTKIQVVVQYNVYASNMDTAFNIRATMADSSQTFDSYSVQICASRKQRVNTMVVVEVYLPSGFSGDQDRDRGGVRGLKYVEPQSHRVNFYFDPLDVSETCFWMKAGRIDKVTTSQQLPILIYDYYEPRTLTSEAIAVKIVGSKTITIPLAGKNVFTDIDVIAQVGDTATGTTVTNEVKITYRGSTALSWTLEPKRETFVPGLNFVSYLKFEATRSKTVQMEVMTTETIIKTCRKSLPHYKYRETTSSTKTINVIVNANGYGMISLSPGVDARTITLSPPGIVQDYNIPYLISLTRDQIGVANDIQLTLPENAVPGTKKVYATITGDIIAPSMQGLESLIRMPTGCGEQTMMYLAPNIYVLQYLIATNQITEAIRATAIERINKGKDKELCWRRPEGSFAVWGTRSPKGSIWLTSFVLRCFHTANSYIPIAEEIFNEGIEWLVSKQQGDGAFIDDNTVIHYQMLGGVRGNRVAMTSYVLLTLLENHDIDGFKEQVKHAKNKAVNYIVANMNALRGNQHGLALASYALAKAGRKDKASELYQLLVAESINKDGMMYWKKGCQGRCKRAIRRWQSPNPRARPIDIETASYALLYLSENNMVEDAMRVTKWLTSQRNPTGGFTTSQDTVVSLEALSKISTLLKTGGNEATDMDITIKADIDPPHKVKINNANRQLVRKIEVLYVSYHFMYLKVVLTCKLFYINSAPGEMRS
ncbi:hypothetical protein FSP39_019395 [Pinctada imbricata]|uniref:CD109 n=1 Tax=Pinctada imbricata TaxID=66713 RepID=A0AA88Y977_PINIB|nr:hypothetical protein FSP39_019395 [Pinctada imbricata]